MSANETQSTNWRGLILPGVMTLVALAILVSLGSWQLRRLEWKESLIARMQARVHAAPQPLPARDAWAKLQLPDFEYLRVTARGVFEHQHETLVFHAGGSGVLEPAFW